MAGAAEKGENGVQVPPAAARQMMEAAAEGRLLQVERLTKAHPHALGVRGPEGQTPAHIAAFFGRREVLQHIALKDPELLFAQTPDGETPAHSAAAEGHTECVTFLATHSLSHMFARDTDGWTLAHSAACYARLEVLVALVRIAPSLFGILTHAGHLPSDVAAEVSAKLFIRHLESICKTTPSRPPSCPPPAPGRY